MLTQLTLCLILSGLMASDKGFGPGQKSRFHLLRDQINTCKKGEETFIIQVDTPAMTYAATVGGSPQPLPPPREKEKGECQHYMSQPGSRQDDEKNILKYRGVATIVY